MSSARADYAAAADHLASRVLGALRGAGGTVALVARHVDSAPDPLAALAAVRVLGADTFTPRVLIGAPFHAEDAAAVARSFDAFPAARTGTLDRTDERTVAWRDWATAQLLARYGGQHAPACTPRSPRATAPSPTPPTGSAGPCAWPSSPRSPPPASTARCTRRPAARRCRSAGASPGRSCAATSPRPSG
ncbi:hypothetical protein ACFQ2B_17495 [Streptomyces stramineus]